MEKIYSSFEKLFEKIPGGVFPIIGNCIYITVIFIGYVSTPGYNMFNNYISDLGAVPGMIGLLFNIGVVLSGALGIPFSVFLGKYLLEEGANKNRTNLIVILGLIVNILVSLSGFFPFIPNTIYYTIHLFIALINFPLLVIVLISSSLLIGSIQEFPRKLYYILLLFSLLNIPFFFIMFLAQLLIFEWLLFFISIAWILIVAIYTLKKT
ncbi:MAG: DUF998 domain-containing protein [Candidatus Helarchaeota archaeon]|nr:DUF998 domain-containing protein [Candidatus Helarchaeota archaeon]